MVLPRRRTVIASSCGSHRLQSILLLAFLLVSLVESFSISSRSRGSIRRTTTTTSLPFQHLQRHYQRFAPSVASSRLHLADNNADAGKEDDDLPFSNNIWEQLAQNFCDIENNPAELANFVQYVSLLRVGIPSAAAAVTAMTIYPTAALSLAALLNDSGVFAVVSQDASQYIQNILTTSGLVFSLLVGQTYYFMYQQQEAIYLALFEEVTAAKSLLEQVALVSAGRESLYHRILQCMDRYVRDDLVRFNQVEPAVLLSARPVDDPLQDILYLTSVGEPSIVYQTVRSLRQARSYRLGALQRKLPDVHMLLLWSLAAIVLMVFPLLGAGSQIIGGMGILRVQAVYLSFIVFGICLTMGVIGELQRPADLGAYNAQVVLKVMVAGLQEELEGRLEGTIAMSAYGPSVDSDGEFDFENGLVAAAAMDRTDTD